MTFQQPKTNFLVRILCSVGSQFQEFQWELHFQNFDANSTIAHKAAPILKVFLALTSLDTARSIQVTFFHRTGMYLPLQASQVDPNFRLHPIRPIYIDDANPVNWGRSCKHTILSDDWVNCLAVADNLPGIRNTGSLHRSNPRNVLTRLGIGYADLASRIEGWHPYYS